MRLTYGSVQRVAQQSVSSKLLVDMGIKNPDFLPTIFAMFPDKARLISILDAKGMKSGMSEDGLMGSKRYRAVTSNHVQYRIDGDDMRKDYLRSNIDGVTFIDDVNPTQPGLGGNGFYIFLDSNWVGGKEVILLADQKTQLWVASDEGGVEVPGGVFRYYVKMLGGNNEAYVDTTFLQDGDECQAVYNLHEQDFSKFGAQKYKFNNQWGDAYLSLMRFSYSYSGTAKAMDKNLDKDVLGRFVSNGSGQQSFISEADFQMMQNIAESLDFQLMEGQGSVSQDTKKVTLSDDKGQEVLAGSGMLYANDGPIEYPQNNGWTKKWIENFLTDIDQYVTPGANGEREVLMTVAPRSYMSFNNLMAEMRLTQNNNIVGDGGEKVVIDTYKGYEIGGLKLLVARDNRLNNAPAKEFVDGTKNSDWRCIATPLGMTKTGQNGLELIQLRPMVKGTVAGIDQGGNVSSSIDGTSVHALTQTGIVSQIQPIVVYRPGVYNV